MRKIYLALLIFLVSCSSRFKSEIEVTFCDNRPKKNIVAFTVISRQLIDNYERALPEYT
jgi:hypothetical protein